MRYELIEGDTKIINALMKDGWTLENTFPNPHPMPYFFALMRLNTMDEDDYNIQAAIEKNRTDCHPF